MSRWSRETEEENGHLLSYASDGLVSADGYLETLQSRTKNPKEERVILLARAKIQEVARLLSGHVQEDGAPSSQMTLESGDE
jgi:hypothetical protein